MVYNCWDLGGGGAASSYRTGHLRIYQIVTYDHFPNHYYFTLTCFRFSSIIVDLWQYPREYSEWFTTSLLCPSRGQCLFCCCFTSQRNSTSNILHGINGYNVRTWYALRVYVVGYYDVNRVLPELAIVNSILLMKTSRKMSMQVSEVYCLTFH